MSSGMLLKGLKVVTLLAAMTLCLTDAASTQPYERRQEIREGSREINHERREAAREVAAADNPVERRHEIREGSREVNHERREAQREVRTAW